MTALLTTVWLVSFLVAAVMLLALLHTERHTDNPAPVATLAVALLFLPPLGVLGAAVFWARQHRPAEIRSNARAETTSPLAAATTQPSAR